MMAENPINSTLLTKITPPDLSDSRYAESLSEVINNIQDNFNKISSLPFLQGADGASFETVREDLFIREDTAIDKDTPLSMWGRMIALAVLLIDNPETDLEREFNDGLTAMLRDMDNTVTINVIDMFIHDKEIEKLASINNITALDAMLYNDYITCYVTRDDSNRITNEYLAQLYYHMDMRLGEISGDEILFDDTSCFLTYDATTGVFSRLAIAPQIYFNEESKSWCWKINGFETGVPARGVKGEGGKAGASVHLVTVSQIPSEAHVNIWHTKKIKFIQHHIGSNQWEWIEIEKSDIKPNNGDLCWIAIYSNGGDPSTGTIVNYAFGVAIAYEDKYSVYYHETDLIRTWGDKLKDQLNHINSRAGEGILANGCRGLWIPSGDSELTTDPTDTTASSAITNVHMLWCQDGSNDIIFGMVENPSVVNPEPYKKDDMFPQLQVLYNQDLAGFLRVGDTLDVTGKATLRGTADVLSRLSVKNGSDRTATLDLGNAYQLISDKSEDVYEKVIGNNYRLISLNKGYEQLFVPVSICSSPLFKPGYMFSVQGQSYLDGDTFINRLGVGTSPVNSYRLAVGGNTKINGSLDVTGDEKIQSTLRVGKETYCDTIKGNSGSVVNIGDNTYKHNLKTFGLGLFGSGENVVVDPNIYGASDVRDKYWPENGSDNSFALPRINNWGPNGDAFLSKNTYAYISIPSILVSCAATVGWSNSKVYGCTLKVSWTIYLKGSDESTVILSSNAKEAYDEGGWYTVSDAYLDFRHTFTIGSVSGQISVKNNVRYTLCIDVRADGSISSYSTGNQWFSNGPYIDGGPRSSASGSWTQTAAVSGNTSKTVIFANGIITGFDRNNIGGIIADGNTNAGVQFVTYSESGDSMWRPMRDLCCAPGELRKALKAQLT